MRTTRSVALAVALGGAFLLSSCASGGPTASDEAMSCDELSSEVRDISNGSQNTLAAVTDPAAAGDYLDEAQGRVEALAENFGDNDTVTAALSELEDAIAGAAEAVADAPTADPDDEAATPPDFTAEQVAIDDAATKARESCSPGDE